MATKMTADGENIICPLNNLGAQIGRIPQYLLTLWQSVVLIIELCSMKISNSVPLNGIKHVMCRASFHAGYGPANFLRVSQTLTFVSGVGLGDFSLHTSCLIMYLLPDIGNKYSCFVIETEMQCHKIF